jgi:hypothetical protein
MAAIASGLNFSTLSTDGINLAVCTTISNTTPEYPNLPFAFGTKTIGLDESEWVFAKPAGAYPVGTVGFLDASWNFTAITTANAAAISGLKVGVLSQVASITASPSANQNSVPWAYDGIWVQTDGLCPAILGAASSAANAQLFTTTVAGEVTSVSGGGNVALNGIILTTAVGSGGAANAPGLLSAPEVLLTS